MIYQKAASQNLRVMRLVAAALMLPTTATPAAAQILAGVEARRDLVEYRFVNPSSIDTSELVPHFFRQRYSLDNLWVSITAGYRLGLDWETSAGLTPERRLMADDYDTFFDPDGTVWVSGTTGDALMRSLRFTQHARLGRVGPATLTGGYRFRLDRAAFLPSHKTVTRNGVVVDARDVATHEYTTAQLHEVFVGLSFTQQISRRWRVGVEGDAAPGAIARLLIQLPEKYPGQSLVFRTTALTTSAYAELATTNTRWPLTVAADLGRAWNYRSDGTLARHGFGTRVTLGRAW